MRSRIGVLLILVLALFATTASAQQVMATYAVKGGLGIGSLSSDLPEEEGVPQDSRMGVVVGASVEIPYKMLSFVIEGLYNQKGATDTFEGTDVEAKINYLQIPFLAKFAFNQMSNVRPFVYAGGAPAFTTSAKFKFGDEEEDIADSIKSTDFGILLGGGVQFNRFAAEVRYDMGLMNVNGEFENGVAQEISTRQIAFLLSVLFGGQ
jgi:opacity protein-like surface antigen